MLFLAFLCLPLLKSVVSPTPLYVLQDQDGIAETGSVSSDRRPNFLRRWDAAANEGFAGRDILIHWNNLLQVRLLKVSPVDRVALGRDGWLFLDGPHLEMDYFRAEKPFSEEELAGWRRVLLQRHIWLERQGIRFVFVIAPNKSTIYPENVTPRVHRGRSRLEQLQDYLARRPLPAGFLMIDLRKTLRAAKARYPVYMKTDSHWNDFGAMLATNQIVRALSRFYPLQPPGMNDFTVSLEPAAPGGDIASMLSLSDVFLESKPVHVTPRSPFKGIVAEPLHWIDEKLQKEVTVRPGAPLPEALMFRDSFGLAPAKYLSEHFQKITYIRDMGLGFHPRFVQEVRPRIVIQELAERFLLILPPYNPQPLAAISVDQ